MADYLSIQVQLSLLLKHKDKVGLLPVKIASLGKRRAHVRISSIIVARKYFWS